MPERQCPECGCTTGSVTQFDALWGWRYVCGRCEHSFWWGIMQARP